MLYRLLNTKTKNKSVFTNLLLFTILNSSQQSQPWCQPQDNLIKPKLLLTGLDFVQYPYMIVQQLFSLLRNRLTMRLKEKLTTEPPPRKEKEPRWQNW